MNYEIIVRTESKQSDFKMSFLCDALILVTN